MGSWGTGLLQPEVVGAAYRGGGRGFSFGGSRRAFSRGLEVISRTEFIVREKVIAFDVTCLLSQPSAYSISNN